MESFFLEEQSDREKTLFSFAYRVKLKNLGADTVQLISRHWIITDSIGSVQEVKGLGVVGEQPVLEPGSEYEYVSGSQLHSPMGTMEGKYNMRSATGETFDVQIPVFTLAVPGAIN